MEEVSPVPAVAHESVGDSLRIAREQQGLALSEVASRTRVPLRHLEALEAGSYNSLPSPTYATGFVRAYARAVGLDEVAITRRVRDELANSGPRAPEYQPYQAPDPARVPSRGLAVVTLGVAIAIIILAGLWYGGVLQRDGATGTTTPVAQAPVATTPAAGTAPAPVPTAAVPTGGQVALETTAPVWLRVRDGERTLYTGTMNPGERFDVPADAQNPLADVGQPDKLKVTLNGSVLPMLPASDRPMRGLRVGAAAVAARLSGQVAPIAGPTAAAPGTPLPANGPATASAPRTTTPARAQPRPRSQPGDETARANIEAAGDTPAPAPTTTP